MVDPNVGFHFGLLLDILFYNTPTRVVFVLCRYKQEVYDLAMQRKAQTERGAEEGYVLPTSYDEPSARSGRYEAAMQRYKEPDAEGDGGNPYAEQVWQSLLH